MNNIAQSLKNFWDKLKKIKHIEIYLTAIFAIIIVMIYLSSLSSSNHDNTGQVSIDYSQSQNQTQEYVENLENKLVNVLSKVKGAGDVNVVITLEKGFEYLYVTEEQVRTNADGSQVRTQTVVMVDGEPMIEQEILPVIKGILVTASGAKDVLVL